MGELTPAARKQGEGMIQGVLVVKIEAGREELEMVRVGDVLSDLGDVAIDSVADFKAQLKKLKNLKSLVLVFYRGDEVILVEIGDDG